MWWLVIKALLSILPAIISAVRDGKIKSAAQDEVLEALMAGLKTKIDAAIKAGTGPLLNEDDDPFNRDRDTRTPHSGLRLDLE